MEEGSVSMNLSKRKRWRGQSDSKTTIKKREQTHPVCLHTAEKYEKVESINTQNGYKTASK